MADSWGRRPLLVIGSFVFVLGSLFCVWAPRIELILLGRFIQGIGVGAPLTIAAAVIADIYQGEKAARLLSVMNTAITVVMAIAPILGVYLTEYYGWRSTFIAIGVGAFLGAGLVSWLLPETHENRQPFHMRQIIAGYRTLLTNRIFIFATLSISFLAAAYFLFIGIAPLLLMETLGVSLNQYAYYQGSVVGTFAAMSLIIPFLLNHFDSDRMLKWSFWTCLFAGTILFGIGVLHLEHPISITLFMCLFAGGIALPGCLIFAIVMEMFPALRGSSAALFQALRLLTMAIVTSIMGAVYDGTFLYAGILIFILAISAFFLGLAVSQARKKS